MKNNVEALRKKGVVTGGHNLNWMKGEAEMKLFQLLVFSPVSSQNKKEKKRRKKRMLSPNI